VSPRPASRAPLASSLVRARLHRPQARTTWPPCSRGAALPGGAASCAVWPRHVAPVCADAGLACMQGRAGAAAAPLSPWWPRGGPRAPPARACPALPPADGAGLDPGPDRMRWAQTGGRRLLVRGVSAPPSAPFVHHAQACADTAPRSWHARACSHVQRHAFGGCPDKARRRLPTRTSPSRCQAAGGCVSMRWETVFTLPALPRKAASPGRLGPLPRSPSKGCLSSMHGRPAGGGEGPACVWSRRRVARRAAQAAAARSSARSRARARAAGL